MKVSVLVVLIVLPMLVSLGLYCYAFLSTRWSYVDEDYIRRHSPAANERDQVSSTNNVALESQYVRHAFRSRYGLFGYCLDYKWLNLLMVKSSPIHLDGRADSKMNSTLSCQRCDSSKPTLTCQQTGCCMTACDNIPDCPSYVDEKNCERTYNQTRYYWPAENCIWQSTWIGNQPLPRLLSSSSVSAREFHSHTKRIRYYIMFLLFAAAPLFTFVALTILLCINCVERFYSIPFVFVSVFSLASFTSGAGGLGLFLYEWIQQRLYRPDFTFESNQVESLIFAFNPWMINVERLGLAFWITVAAIGTSLFTTLLSCCFCCGLQSDKSKLRIYVKNDKYEIVHMSAYDE